MSISFKKRLVVALLLIAISAVSASVASKSFALVFFAVALLAIIGALILAIINVPPQQRKLTLILVPIIMLVCGVGMYLFLNFIHVK